MKNEQIPSIKIVSKNDEQVISGTWFRGKHCNFYPSKKEFKDENFFNDYILKGFRPKKPFLNKNKKIIAFGSCFASHVSEYLVKKSIQFFINNLVIILILLDMVKEWLTHLLY